MAHVYGVDGYVICTLYEEKVKKIEQTVKVKQNKDGGELHSLLVEHGQHGPGPMKMVISIEPFK